MEMSDKKVVLVVGGDCGGAERITILYGKILKKAGFDITLLVYTPQVQSDYPLKHFIPADWCVELITGKFRKYPFKLLRIIRKYKPDIVFSSSSYSAQFSILFKLFHLTKAKVIVRENTSPTRKSKIRCRFSHLLYPHAFAVIAQTKEMKDEMTKFYKMKDSQIIVINNPLDIEQIQIKSKEHFPFDHNYTNYVAIGRLATPKDYPTLLNAFAIVHKANLNTRLYIVGGCESNKKKEELEQIIQYNSLSNSVFFEGFQPNPYKYLRWCDVFCLSSSIEGLPNVLLEALYLHKPVVATRCVPFVTQVVKEGRNGYTCNVKDSKAFAKAMMNSISLIGKDVAFVHKTEEDVIKIFEK